MHGIESASGGEEREAGQLSF
uniref:Uncharacterized protein n=1 Tax=Arundo donax TaxID=35708 RepID=A0A0A8ZYH0_ARUDO